MDKVNPKTPILVGGGQKTHAPKSGYSLSPIEMMAQAAQSALADCGAGDIAKEVDCITITRFIHDAPGLFTEDLAQHRYPFGVYANPPKSVAKALEIEPQHYVYGPTGGNSPQLLINLMAERIAQGQYNLVVLSGTECLNSLIDALKNGDKLDWKDDLTKEGMEDLGKGEIDGTTANETAHGLNLPINIYPMFENAIRAHKGRSITEHQKKLGVLMSPFTKVAAAHPNAWFPVERSGEEITAPSDANRFIGFPYTKYLNAIMRVDQAASVVMTNVETAERLAIPRERWVFLHGCADANDIWYPSERINYYESPAIKKMGEVAFQMANWNINEMDYIDLYSCFPSAVQLGMAALGIEEGDKRGLTITGGLPYFGGAGNNYVMHSVATMLDKLRAKPNSKGICTANGYYATKHSIGLYSTEPLQGSWQRTPPKQIQAELDSMPHPKAIDQARGKAKLITYTVCFGRKGIENGLMIGETEDGKRFCAAITDKPFLEKIMAEDCLGTMGEVSHKDGINIWRAS